MLLGPLLNTLSQVTLILWKFQFLLPLLNVIKTFLINPLCQFSLKLRYNKFFGLNCRCRCYKLKFSNFTCFIINSVASLFTMSIFLKIKAHVSLGTKLDLKLSGSQNFQIPIAPLKLTPFNCSLCQFSLKMKHLNFGTTMELTAGNYLIVCLGIYFFC